jgi:hypothetical protein
VVLVLPLYFHLGDVLKVPLIEAQGNLDPGFSERPAKTANKLGTVAQYTPSGAAAKLGGHRAVLNDPTTIACLAPREGRDRRLTKMEPRLRSHSFYGGWVNDDFGKALQLRFGIFDQKLSPLVQSLGLENGSS